MNKTLEKLVKDEYLWGYEINDRKELTIRYGFSNVYDTERVIDIENKVLSKAFLDSANDLKDDIMCCLCDDEDYFGYSNKEELEYRIKEETEYLKLLSDIVKEYE